MAQMSLEELYRGEGVGEKYGIMGEVMKDFLQNGRPSEYDERTWLEMLLVKHAPVSYTHLLILAHLLLVKDVLMKYSKR